MSGGRRRLAATTAAVAVVALLVAGCGGGDDDPTVGGDDAGTTTTAGDTTTTTAPAPAGPPTQAQLEQALLTVDDLPEGYETTRSDDDEDDGATGDECVEIDVDDEFPPVVEAERSWQHRRAGGFADQEIAAYEPGVAAQAFARGVELLQRCAEFTAEEDGQTIQGTIRPLDVPALGDESAGFEMQATIGDVPVAGHIVAIRAGDVISAVTRLAVNSQPDKAVTDALAQRAADKLAALA